MPFKIKNRIISQKKPPYIVAELSANHNGSLKKALNTIKAAKKNGADAIKIQTYTPDTMTINSNKKDFKIKKGLWKDYTLYDLYKWAHTPYEWQKEIFKYCDEINIPVFSTPFDKSAVDLLEKLNTPVYKVASFEITDHELLKVISKTKKPMLISTGMASKREIDEALEVIYKQCNNDVLLFHCISSYPTNIKEANINKITQLKNDYNIEIGLSDHTLGNTAALASVSLGASIIEKHFIISRNEKGPDSKFSMEPNELKSLVNESKNAWLALGSKTYARSKKEKENLIFRRSLYFVKNLKYGQLINKSDIRSIRPGYGLHPKFLNRIIGKKVRQKVSKGTRVEWRLIK